jgi:hypothetical protein
MQHKLEIKKENFFERIYTTNEDGGNHMICFYWY